MVKQSPPASHQLPEPQICVPVHRLWLRLQNKQGKSQKMPFALQQPFFSRPHCYVLVFHPLLAPSWVRDFLNKKIPTNLLLQGVPQGEDRGEGRCSLDPLLRVKQGSISSRVQRSGVDTAQGGERKKKE